MCFYFGLFFGPICLRFAALRHRITDTSALLVAHNPIGLAE